MKPATLAIIVIVGSVAIMLALGVILSGLNPLSPAHIAVKSLVADPNGIEFQSEQISKDRQKVCGEFNARNRFGAFVGFSPYLYDAKESTVYALLDPAEQMRMFFASSDANDRVSTSDAEKQINERCIIVERWQADCPGLPEQAIDRVRPLCDLWAKKNGGGLSELGRQFGY